MTDILKLVGNRIRALRNAQKMSQEMLAEKAGLHFTYVGGVERGERNVSLRNLHKIARGLGIELGELLEFSKTAKEGPRVELFAALQSADDRTVEFVLDVARSVQKLRKSDSGCR
jgi:transcriptional regulator with XRE-family HTH domain